MKREENMKYWKKKSQIWYKPYEHQMTLIWPCNATQGQMSESNFIFFNI